MMDDGEGIAMITDSRRAKKNSTTVAFLYVVILVCLCITLMALVSFGIMLYSYGYQRKIYNKEKESYLSVESCKLLKGKLEDVQVTDNLFFSNQFLADMRSEIRSRLIDSMTKVAGDDGILYIQGPSKPEEMLIDKNFLYITGENNLKCQVIVDLKSKECTLFVPKNPGSLVWDLPYIETLNQTKNRLGVFKVDYDENLLSIMNSYNRTTVYFLNDQQNLFKNKTSSYIVDNSLLFKSLRTMREAKTNSEVKIMKKVAQISSEAHIQVMKMIKPRVMEFTLMSAFKFMTGTCGAVTQAYEPICAGGPRSAVLHYELNTARIPPKMNPIGNDIFLIDAGAELLGYASDITRTYPADGKFNELQRKIYNAVLDIQTKSIQLIKPGVDYKVIMKFASNLLIEKLQDLNFVSKEYSVDDLYAKRVNSIFMPHGLGHLVGLDVHDTTTYPSVPLAPNTIVTVEPGIYFGSSSITEEVLALPYINADVVRPLVGVFGGIRIEDEILVTEDGYEVISSIIPKTVEDIERLMK
ncbi:Xaa-Pro dipeptidase [Acrasis kona]|uniref:Xaa-Pro dipeptidase n=1 Tax=Acrasis kona TaxID=1008807 RepID=A0AAW2ZEM3_9EUKA